MEYVRKYLEAQNMIEFNYKITITNLIKLQIQYTIQKKNYKLITKLHSWKPNVFNRQILQML